MSVEVERKFVCDPDIQGKLKAVGALCVGQRRFQDQYFDSADYTLTLQNIWLRRREGCWELKCPVARKPAETGNGTDTLCSQYREITVLPEIRAELRRVLSIERPRDACGSHTAVVDRDAKGEDVVRSSSDEEEWIQDLQLVCFANFYTERCSYLLGGAVEQGGVRVDLDRADFGFCVGEIEVLLEEGGNVQCALQRIGNTAVKLGLDGNKRVPGKMDTYLQRFCPDHYAKLLAAHIL